MRIITPAPRKNGGGHYKLPPGSHTTHFFHVEFTEGTEKYVQTGDPTDPATWRRETETTFTCARWMGTHDVVPLMGERALKLHLIGLIHVLGLWCVQERLAFNHYRPLLVDYMGSTASPAHIQKMIDQEEAERASARRQGRR
jgi:hypothetical protein